VCDVGLSTRSLYW